jgi:N-acetylmuramoyl-L-alanine amidase
MLKQPYTQLAPTDLLKLCVWREARSQAYECQLGVAYSVLNRVAHPEWWGKDLQTVILKPWQYSSFDKGDPNETKWPLDDDASWLSCCKAVDAALQKSEPDPTNGATSYFSIPAWALAMDFLAQVDRMRFYREKQA